MFLPPGPGFNKVPFNGPTHWYKALLPSSQVLEDLAALKIALKELPVPRSGDIKQPDGKDALLIVVVEEILAKAAMDALHSSADKIIAEQVPLVTTMLAVRLDRAMRVEQGHSINGFRPDSKSVMLL